MKLNKVFAEKRFLHGDMVVWMIFLLLCMISVVEVYSASSNMSFKTGHYWGPIVEHGSYVIVGIALAWVIHLFPCNIFKLLSTFLLHVVAYPMLIYVLFFGSKVNAAARWLVIGGKTIQPSEIAKIALVGFAAFILATLRDGNNASKLACKIVVVEVLAVVGLIVTENASTAGIIFLVMYGICFFARVPNKYLGWLTALLIGAGIGGLVLAHSIPESTLDRWASPEYQDKLVHRVPTWVHRITDKHELPEDPAKYDITDNIQVTHAQIAVATCNIVGKGPGNSVQRDFLPQAYSDFIYAIIIEEGGIASGAFVMFLYLLLMWRAMKIASRCKSLFPAYLVMGLALMMVVQAMVNMTVATQAVPIVTGQPLPLISRGGTSTFINCTYIGIILSVSRSAKKKDPKKEKEKETDTLPAEA